MARLFLFGRARANRNVSLKTRYEIGYSVLLFGIFFLLTFFFKINFFKKESSFKNTIRVSNGLDLVCPDLVPSYLQRL